MVLFPSDLELHPKIWGILLSLRNGHTDLSNIIELPSEASWPEGPEAGRPPRDTVLPLSIDNTKSSPLSEASERVDSLSRRCNDSFKYTIRAVFG
jgi:hypothetical protein